jgi:hypothetical protein
VNGRIICYGSWPRQVSVSCAAVVYRIGRSPPSCFIERSPALCLLRQARLSSLEAEAQQLAGAEFNLASPKQVAEVRGGAVAARLVGGVWRA